MVRLAAASSCLRKRGDHVDRTGRQPLSRRLGLLHRAPRQQTAITLPGRQADRRKLRREPLSADRVPALRGCGTGTKREGGAERSGRRTHRDRGRSCRPAVDPDRRRPDRPVGTLGERAFSAVPSRPQCPGAAQRGTDRRARLLVPSRRRPDGQARLHGGLQRRHSTRRHFIRTLVVHGPRDETDCNAGRSVILGCSRRRHAPDRAHAGLPQPGSASTWTPAARSPATGTTRQPIGWRSAWTRLCRWPPLRHGPCAGLPFI